MTTGRVLGLWARLQKLRAMSGPEVVHRLRYETALRNERRQHAAGSLAPPERLRRALGMHGQGADWARRLSEARKADKGRFLPGVGERQAMRELFRTRYAAEAEATLRQAADARAHRFAFFGQTFEYGDEIPWQADPVTGRRWPSVFHADVPVHGGDAGYGDVKYVWELNRQQFLIDVAKSWFLSGDDQDVAAVRRFVRSWIDGNPYATGVNWACTLEPAFRIFSWLWAYHLTFDALDEEFHIEWLEGFYDHGRFIERHLEHYSSPYNHLIAEAASLYMLGACFPQFADAPRWRATGKAVMTNRLGEQFYRDGGSVEQSTFYHHATVGFYLLAGLTARATGDDLAPAIWQAIERGLDFSMALSQPDGSTPAIGGADDGKPIRMEHLPFWDFRPYLAVGAVVFNRPDFKSVAGRFHEDALWLTGTAGLRAFDQLPAETPRYTSIELPASGYFVLRNDWTEHADYVCFDCGEQAAGMRHDAVSNSMHGHADCLSVVVWLAGKPVLIDSGLFAYNCGGEWEAHFRETAAHNTARIDGRDQARHLGKMAWSHSFRASLEGWNAAGVHAWAIGSHDGYARGPDGLRHRRAVWLQPDRYVLLFDEFEGTGAHELEVNFQFAPGTLDSAGEDRLVFNKGVEVVWGGSQPWSVRTACGGPGPADGWMAPSLGMRRPSPRATFSCRTSGEPRSTLLTILALSPDGAPRVSVLTPERTSRMQRYVAVAGTDAIDVVAAGDLSVPGPIESDARVVVCRVPRAAPAKAFAHRLGGTRADVNLGAIERMVDTRTAVPEVGR